MLTVDDYGAIRRAFRDGMTIKRIAREFRHSRNTIRKILRDSEPNPIPPGSGHAIRAHLVKQSGPTWVTST